jgi:uncharacterized membrane protein YfcA
MQSFSPVYTFVGFGVGLLAGMTGIGGGALMTPLLITLFGLHPEAAVGTDLLYASGTKSAGTTIHSLMRSVDWQMVRNLATGSIPSAALTIGILWWIGFGTEEVAALIRTVLGCVLILTAATMLLRNWLVQRFSSPAFFESRRTTRLTIATGAALGVLVSIASVGAGALGITALLLLYPRLSVTRIVGSDIAHAVPLTLVAGMGHSLLGNPNWFVIGTLLIGSIPGIVLGSWFVNRTSQTLVRTLLATVLLIVGFRFTAGI